jgi:hypothetical protein
MNVLAELRERFATALVALGIDTAEANGLVELVLPSQDWANRRANWLSGSWTRSTFEISATSSKWPAPVSLTFVSATIG